MLLFISLSLSTVNIFALWADWKKVTQNSLLGTKIRVTLVNSALNQKEKHRAARNGVSQW